jgi:hypothetical protein
MWRDRRKYCCSSTSNATTQKIDPQVYTLLCKHQHVWCLAKVSKKLPNNQWSDLLLLHCSSKNTDDVAVYVVWSCGFLLPCTELMKEPTSYESSLVRSTRTSLILQYTPCTSTRLESITCCTSDRTHKIRWRNSSRINSCPSAHVSLCVIACLISIRSSCATVMTPCLSCAAASCYREEEEALRYMFIRCLSSWDLQERFLPFFSVWSLFVSCSSKLLLLLLWSR